MVKGHIPESECLHTHAVISFEREGSRFHTSVWMVERCIECGKLMDRTKAPRGYDVYSNRVDK